LELLRLANAPIYPRLQTLEPSVSWRAHERDQGALAVSPDGKRILTGAWFQDLKLWNAETYELLRTVRNADSIKMPCGKLTFSPNGAAVLVEEDPWVDCVVLDANALKPIRTLDEPDEEHQLFGLSKPSFSPDARLVFLSSSRKVERVFDTRDWKPRSIPDDLPKDTTAIVLGNREPKAVIQRGNDIVFWNRAEKRVVQTLVSGETLDSAAFSPDDSMVATIHGTQGQGALDQPSEDLGHDPRQSDSRPVSVRARGQ
jgi:WD40 repeat protein